MREPIGSKYIELKGTFDTVSKMMHFLFFFCFVYCLLLLYQLMMSIVIIKVRYSIYFKILFFFRAWGVLLIII